MKSEGAPKCWVCGQVMSCQGGPGNPGVHICRQCGVSLADDDPGVMILEEVPNGRRV